VIDEDESEENKKLREEMIKRDREKFEALDRHTQEIVKSLEGIKKIDEYHSEVIKA
jgi:hypothetical protein